MLAFINFHILSTGPWSSIVFMCTCRAVRVLYKGRLCRQEPDCKMEEAGLREPVLLTLHPNTRYQLWNKLHLQSPKEQAGSCKWIKWYQSTYLNHCQWRWSHCVFVLKKSFNVGCTMRPLLTIFKKVTQLSQVYLLFNIHRRKWEEKQIKPLTLQTATWFNLGYPVSIYFLARLL